MLSEILERKELTSKEKINFLKLKKTILDNYYIPHEPTDKQVKFLLDDREELLYGGAAGGGKSDALLMGALQYVDEPDYSAILFRKSFSDLKLPDGLIPRSHEWLDSTDATYKAQDKVWKFPSGATLTFGYLQYEEQKKRYQSSAYQYIGFDELTQFTESQYRYLFSRLRRLKGSNVPMRMRGASNPEDNWVKDRFDVKQEGEGEPFIPADMKDNPFLDHESYEASLNKMDIVDRKRLKYGNWEIKKSGNMFKREWFEIVERAPNTLNDWTRYWDKGATEVNDNNQDPDWTVGVKAGVKNGITYIKDMKRKRGRPAMIENLIKQTAILDKEDSRKLKIFIEEEGGSSGKESISHYKRNILSNFNFEGDRVTGSKSERASPLSAAAERGEVKLVRGDWDIDAFLDELETFPGGTHDDIVDATSGVYNKLNTGKVVDLRPRSKKPAGF